MSDNERPAEERSSVATVQRTIWDTYELLYMEKGEDGTWENKVVFEGTCDEVMDELEKRSLDNEAGGVA